MLKKPRLYFCRKKFCELQKKKNLPSPLKWRKYEFKEETELLQVAKVVSDFISFKIQMFS